jgi:hypothetical protein
VSLYGSLLSPELNFHLACLKSENFFVLLFSSAYALLFAQAFSFHNDRKYPRGARRARALRRRACLARALRRRIHFPLSTLFSFVCGLFAPVAKLNSHFFNTMRALSQKMLGVPTTGRRNLPFALRVSSFAFRVSSSDVQTFRRLDVQTRPLWIRREAISERLPPEAAG